MKTKTLIVLSLLSFATALADTNGAPTYSNGPADSRISIGEAVKSEEATNLVPLIPQVAPQPAPPQPRFYAVPQIQEFYIPLQTTSTALGAMFGSLKRQEKELVAYWEQRKQQLNDENSACLALSGNDAIAQCLQNVRVTEIRKTSAIKSLNEQQVNQQYMRSLYYQAAFRDIGNQMRYSAPRTTNCNTIGSYGYANTNCTSY